MALSSVRIWTQKHNPVLKKRIAIFGNYKTGTTATYYRILEALPSSTAGHFEPDSYQSRRARVELAKVILGHDFDYQPFIDFDKQLLIVRDPRDWIVSGMLFLPQQLETIYRHPDRVSDTIGMLEEKVLHPSKIPVYQILEEIVRYSTTQTFPDLLDSIAFLLKNQIAFEERLANVFRLYYEAFVDNQLQDLERYLGLKLPVAFNIASEHQHVARSSTYGSWMHWFTQGDIEMFRPIILPFMEHYGYADSWELAPHPIIDSKQASEYVRITIERRLAVNRQRDR